MVQPTLPKQLLWPGAYLFALTLVAILLAYEVGFVINTVVSIWPAAAVVFWAIRQYGFSGFVATTLAGCVHSIFWLQAPPVNLIIPVASSLCAWLGVLLERRANPGQDIFAGTRAISAFLLAGMGVFSLSSALIGNAIIAVEYDVPWSEYGRGVWNWFLGDYTGGLMLAPLLIKLPSFRADVLSQRGAAATELILSLLALLAIAMVYDSGLMKDYGEFSPMFLALPGAIILATRGANARTCLNYFVFTLAALILTGATAANGEDNSALHSVQLYLTMVLLCGYLLLSLRSERDRLIRELGEQRRELEIRVQERTSELAAEVAERQAIASRMETLARIDPLTGLFNRRYFGEVAARDLKRARRGIDPVSLCILDVDHFKRINDLHGHPAGDSILVEVAEILRAETRDAIDSVVRLGGEEFAILMPKTDLDLAMEVSERIRGSIAEHRFALGCAEDEADASLQITISAGVIECPLTLETIGPAISIADKALYRAKQQGRNRVLRAAFPKRESEGQPEAGGDDQRE